MEQVKPGTWYYGYFNAAYYMGFLRGIESEIKIGQPLSRENIMVVMANSLKTYVSEIYLPDSEIDSILSIYKDESIISKAKREVVAFCVKSGLIVGSNGELVPKGPLFRAQMAVIISKLMDMLD